MIRYQQQKGITLLEIILVLAIAASILTLGFRMYNSYQSELSAFQLKANIDQIFTAMKHYYQVNCRDGTLDPTNGAVTVPAPGGSIVLDLQNDLLNPGYLINLPKNVLVSSYAIQFTRLPDAKMSVFACNMNGSSPPPCIPTPLTTLNGTAPTTGAALTTDTKVVRWMAEVSVTLLDAAKTTALASMLSATSPSSGVLTWQRIPLTITPESNMSWVLDPYIKAFNTQYTNDGMAALSGITWSSSQYDTQYYLCGG